VGYKYQKEVQ
jgi:hypothetical protein